MRELSKSCYFYLGSLVFGRGSARSFFVQNEGDYFFGCARVVFGGDFFVRRERGSVYKLLE